MNMAGYRPATASVSPKRAYTRMRLATMTVGATNEHRKRRARSRLHASSERIATRGRRSEGKTVNPLRSHPDPGQGAMHHDAHRPRAQIGGGARSRHRSGELLVRLATTAAGTGPEAGHRPRPQVPPDRQ